MYEYLTGFFNQFSAPVQALIATTFTWGMTALGATLVFFFREIKRKIMDIMLGFAGGVMLAAAFFSLLSPSVEMSRELSSYVWLPPAAGFALGALFLYALDRLIPHLHPNMTDGTPDGAPSSLHRTTLLILAITLHNIPEGLAVGVAFGAVGAGIEGATVPAAIALAIGIGIQNFPEGTAVSLPFAGAWHETWQEFFLRPAIGRGRAYRCGSGSNGNNGVPTGIAVYTRICGGGYDIRRGGGGYSGNPTRQIRRHRGDEPYRGIHTDDDTRR